MAQHLIPILLFEGQFDEALEFYGSIFADTQIEPLGMNPTGHLSNDSLQIHAILRLNGQRFLCIDSTTKNRKPRVSSQSIYVECTSELEIDATFKALTNGGEILKPLKDYGFSRKFGSLIDKFGTSWQLNLPYFEIQQGNVCMAHNEEVRSEYRH
ncbi:MAG: VOC family protein [Maribacter sp.]|nr:VOC family protein [Maribacter sp.]